MSSARPFALALVIDDDADILVAAQMLLRDLFDEVVTAPSPDAAMTTVVRSPDVILLDGNFARGATNGAEGFRCLDAILAQAQLAGAALAREEVDLSALARDVGEELLAVQPDAGHVRLQIAEGLCAQADALLVRRVLENLLGNALKYSAKVAEPRVEFGCMPATNPPVYFVRDNGAGFDMQHADKLFGMFQRLHSAKDFPGTGVGLAGVRNIVRRHGGRVWAEAQSGQGACFYFTLIGTAEAQRHSGNPVA